MSDRYRGNGLGGTGTGVSYNTVLKDVTQTASPVEVAGADGKTYPAAELSKNGQLPSRITGLDGRERPAAQPKPDPYTWIEPDADEIPGQSHVLEHTALETVTPTAGGQVRTT